MNRGTFLLPLHLLLTSSFLLLSSSVGAGAVGGGDYDPSQHPNNNFLNYDVGPLSAAFLRPLRRLGSEFLGKRTPSSSFEDEMGVGDEDWSGDGLSSPDHPHYPSPLLYSPLEKRARIRMGSEFLGKRRLGSEFLGKKKRYSSGYPALAYPSFGGDYAFSWKRGHRLGSEFLGKRSVGSGDIPIIM